MSFVKRNYIDGETVITAENLNDIQDAIIQIVPDDVKQALLQIASKVAYIDEHGQDYYDALEAALYPDASLVSISAVYTQSGTVYDTDSLDSLKADLVVTAHYDDSTTETVTAYTLSGTLTVGTSTITVAYGGKTTTFDVTVTAYWDYAWDYSMGKLEDQSGWHTDGTGTTELISDGEKISVGSSAYYQILMDNDNPYKYMPDGYGTLEVDCYGVFNTGNGVQNLRITAAKDSTTRLTLIQNKGKWKLLKNATPNSADNTVLADCVDNTAYKVRIVLKGTTADVYLNGEKVASNVSATAAGGFNNTVMQQNSGSGKYGVIQTFKVHLGA